MSNDKSSISQILKWDEESFHALYKLYYKALASYALGIIDDFTVSEDLVQETFSKLWLQKGDFPNMSSLKTWLFNSVRNGAIDYLRHKNIETKHRLSFAKMSLMSHNDVGEDDFFTEEIFRQLFQTIDALPPRQKEVFLLSMKGKRYKDIAQQLNISVETVKKQKQRAMENLKEKLNGDATVLLLLLVMP